MKKPRSIGRYPAGLLLAALLLGGALIISRCGFGQEIGAPGKVLFFDDFDGNQLDTDKWFAGLHQWGPENQGVIPENVRLARIADGDKMVGVLDTQANGDLYTGLVKGLRRSGKEFVRTSDGKRTGGLVITRHAFGAGRYEVRMKNLPLSGGCSCIWNYWDPQDSGGPKGNYTEIDIEMPANGYAGRNDWVNWAGFNTYYPSPDDITPVNKDIGPQNDGKFHIYRWDWYDGTDGPRRVEFFVDGQLKAAIQTHIPHTPAPLWVGNWPAQWSGNFQYDTQHLYIDWVRISELGDPHH